MAGAGSEFRYGVQPSGCTGQRRLKPELHALLQSGLEFTLQVRSSGCTDRGQAKAPSSEQPILLSCQQILSILLSCRKHEGILLSSHLAWLVARRIFSEAGARRTQDRPSRLEGLLRRPRQDPILRSRTDQPRQRPPASSGVDL